MKNTIIPVMILVLLLVVCGCQTNGKNDYKPDLPSDDIVKIEQAYADRFGNELDWYDPINDEGSVFCCGIYGDYIIIVDNVLTRFEREHKDILEIELHRYGTIYLSGFTGDKNVACYAFKEGKLYDLMEVYYAGGITADEIMNATDTYYETF